MNQTLSKIGFALLLAAMTLTLNAAESKKLDTARIDELTGLKGKLNEQEGVYKVSAPRTDLKISVDKWEMPPFMGLTSWAAFMPGMKDGAMVMGDLVLMQEKNPFANRRRKMTTISVIMAPMPDVKTPAPKTNHLTTPHHS